jgi:predicted nucleotidyltransferase
VREAVSAVPLEFGLDPAIVRQLRHLFDAHRDRIECVWIYGSRARGEAQARSDVDLAVDAPQMDAYAFSILQSALEKLLLVRKVELVHWQRIDDERFKREIERGRTLFWEPRRLKRRPKSQARWN